MSRLSTGITICLILLFAQTQAFGLFSRQQNNNRKLEQTTTVINSQVLESATKHIPDLVKDSWAHWKERNSKSYSSDSEETYRMKIFYENYKKISSEDMSMKKFRRGLNKFADQTKEEFRLTRLGLNNFDVEAHLKDKQAKKAARAAKKAEKKAAKAAKKAAKKAKKDDNNSDDNNSDDNNSDDDNSDDDNSDDTTIPTSVDWRDHNAVTGVKNQGSCGSCWSFSASGALEGLNAINNGELTSFSEQQLMDCSTSYGNMSCNGGLMAFAFEYTAVNGIATEASYPYLATDQSCQKFTSAFKNSGNTAVDSDSVDAMKIALAKQPVSIAIAADDIMSYTSGIFDNADCGTGLNHGVLLVGYGSENGEEYWIVKNSWGSNWGENGYIRMAINYDTTGSNGVHGMCGLLMDGDYPTL